MELANVLLALEGDKNMTVPKFDVTPAEIAVLTAIHGGDAVFDIEPTGKEIARSNREEVERLIMQYPARDQDGKSIVLSVYPGHSPILHQTLSDLQLPPELYKTDSRLAPAAPKASKAKAAKPAPLADITPKPTNSADALFDDEPENVLG